MGTVAAPIGKSAALNTQSGMWIEPAPLSLPGSGARVRLEPLALEHAPALFHSLDTPEIWRLRPDVQPRSVSDWEARICACLKQTATGARSMYAVIVLTTGECAGTTGFHAIDETNRSTEIGATIIAAKWHRTFVNTECKCVLLTHAFEVKRAVRVSFVVDMRNERSRAAVLRLGAVQEGVLRRQKICHDGHVRDAAVFSIVDAEWPSVRVRLGALLAVSRERGSAG